MSMPSRRRALQATSASLLAVLLRPASAQALADHPALRAALDRWTLGRPAEPGALQLQLPELVENGQGVPLRVWAEHTMTGADRITELAVYSARNPQPEVLHARFGPACPRAELAGLIRLATSQRLLALARLADGRCWAQTADVVVTLAACVEE
jgi:sulfur-oxidizing protein SoxY